MVLNEDLASTSAMSIMSSSSFITSDGIIGPGVDAGYILDKHSQQQQKCDAGSNCTTAPKTENKSSADNPIHSQLSQLLTKIPCSLLVEIKQHQNHQQRKNRTDIMDIVCDLLNVAAVTGDQCHQQGRNHSSFLSPMIKKPRTLEVDNSELCELPLNNQNNGGENQDDESQKADGGASNITATTADTPRTVRFEHNTPSIQYTISRADMTYEEHRNYWLQDEEFALIRLRDGYLGNLAEQKQREMAAAATQSSTTIIPLSSFIPISAQHWICTRGLEFKMKLRFLQTKTKRLACVETVLIEQERQCDEHWDSGRNNSPFCYDDEAIAAACNGVTKECDIRARKMAASDHQEVEEFLLVEKEAGKYKMNATDTSPKGAKPYRNPIGATLTLRR